MRKKARMHLVLSGLLIESPGFMNNKKERKKYNVFLNKLENTA